MKSVLRWNAAAQGAATYTRTFPGFVTQSCRRKQPRRARPERVQFAGPMSERYSRVHTLLNMAATLTRRSRSQSKDVVEMGKVMEKTLAACAHEQ
jgi:hypothetical protein